MMNLANQSSDKQTSSSSQAVPNLLRERAAIHGSITQVREIMLHLTSNDNCMKKNTSLMHIPD